MALEEDEEIIAEKGVKRGQDAQIIKLLKAIRRCKTLTDEEEKNTDKFRRAWEEGNIPAKLTREILRATKGLTDPVVVYYTIKELLPENYLVERKQRGQVNISGQAKVILSSYLKKGGRKQ